MKNIFIVIRTGSLDTLDAMTAVNKVINKHGYCWFGKYGQPLNKDLLNNIKLENTNYYAILIETDNNVKDGYRYNLYLISDFSFKTPSPKIFPKYYKKIMHRINTWIKLKEYKGKMITLDNLIIKSSAQPLRHALKNSMRGHFLCKLRG